MQNVTESFEEPRFEWVLRTVGFGLILRKINEHTGQKWEAKIVFILEVISILTVNIWKSG